MVISCWPGETFWPGWTDLCPTIPSTGATMVVYCRFSWACSKAARGALGLRLRRFGAGALHGNLLRPGLGVLQLRLRLRNLGARLRDRLFRGGGRRLGRFHGRRRRLLGFHGLRVLELRDLVLRRQRLVPVDVILRLQVIGFCLPQRGLCGVKLPLGGNQPGLEVLHIGRGAGEFDSRCLRK